MSERTLRLGKRGYVVAGRMIPNAAMFFHGPYSLERAEMERTQLLVKRPDANVGVFLLAPVVAGGPGDTT